MTLTLSRNALRKLAIRLSCLTCGHSWRGTVVTPHLCPVCESEVVVTA